MDDEPAKGRSAASTSSAARLLPILGWLRSYDHGWLRGDLIAGVTVAALIVPKNLGTPGSRGFRCRTACMRRRRGPSSTQSSERVGRVAVITLNLPHADSAITTEMGALLTEIIETIAVRTAVESSSSSPAQVTGRSRSAATCANART
ncbi:MAG: hypothetical protein ABI934_10800 [Actinomycetota bacterium]